MNTSPARSKPSLIALVIVIGSLAWAVVLALDIVPDLRGAYGWSYMYDTPQQPLRLLPFVLGALLYIGVGAWLMKRSRPAGLLAWAVIGTVGLTLAGIFIKESPFFKLFGLTVAPDSTGWHIAAAAITDLGKTLREWPAYMVYAYKYSFHLYISPPGAVLFYYGLIQALQGLPGIAHVLAEPLRQAMCQNYTIAEYSDAQLASAWAGMLMPLWGGLCVLPMYKLGAHFFSARAVRWSVLWWPLIPSLLMFTGMLNSFFPFLALCMILVLVNGMARGQRWLVLGAGLLMSVMSFINFVFLPLIFMAGMLVLLNFLARTRLYTASAWAFAPKRAPWLWPFTVGALFGIGLLTVWVVFYAMFGVTFLDILRTAAASHLGLDRPYLPWLFLHLYDYFMFAGWPIVVLAAIGVVAAVRAWFRNHTLDAGATLLISTAATLVALDLSGTLRGETGRILLFFTPFFLYGAGSVVESGAFASDRRAAWILSVGQVIIVAVMLSVLHVMGLMWNTPSPVEPPALTATSPRELIPGGAVFDSVLHLTGFSGVVQDQIAGDGPVSPTLDLWLDWQSSGSVDYPYWMSLLPIAPDGALGQATLRQPFNNKYPMTCWLPRSGAIREHFTVPLPASTKDGAYWVSLALMDRAGKRTTVVMPDGSRDTQAGIGGFTR